MNIEQLIKEGKGTVVDVRSSGEFSGGHVAGSVNIPVQELDMRIDDIRRLPAPLILCCASGNRSGIAMQVLKQKGIECLNAGSWMDVNYYTSQNN